MAVSEKEIESRRKGRRNICYCSSTKGRTAVKGAVLKGHQFPVRFDRYQGEESLYPASAALRRAQGQHDSKCFYSVLGNE